MLEEALADVIDLGHSYGCLVRVRLAALRNAQGDSEGALTLLDAADPDLEALLDPFELASAYIERAWALAALDRTGEALEALNAARSLASECVPGARKVLEARFPKR